MLDRNSGKSKAFGKIIDGHEESDEITHEDVDLVWRKSVGAGTV